MNKKKKWLSLLLSLALLFSLCPQTVSAEEIFDNGQIEETSPFTITGGTEGTDYEWDDTNKKLTIKTDKPLTLSTPNNSADNPATAHIHAPQVSGQGTNAKLTLNGVHITEPQNTGYGAICVTGTLEITLAEGSTNTLTGGAVTNAESNAYNSYGIYSSGALTINGSGTLNAVGGAVTTSSSDNNNRSAGILSESSITINGGTIHATGSSVSNGSSYGLYINDGSITINGGSGTAQANTSSTNHKAMYPNPTYTSGYVTGQEADTFRKWLPKATEQYNALTPGETYWFELSGQKANMGGTVNTELPDAGMNWVPFTYVGTVNAYKLDSAQATTEEYASTHQSAHSLFIANYDLTQASWNDLNDKSLIFGTSYTNNGVTYTLRAPSAGSNTMTVGSGDSQTEYVTPLNNEWDSILMKDSADTTQPEAYIKNATGSNQYSWGQDTSAIENDSAKRIARKGGEYTSNTLPADGTAQSGSNGWYRPVLELPSGADLKVVEVNLNGGLLGDGTNSTPNIVTTSTGAFRAPDVSCITPTSGHVFCGWAIENSASDKRYDAGDLIDNTAQVIKLNANWETAPYIAHHPADSTVASGATASFTVKAIGEVTYQWQSSADGTNWSNVDGATSATLTISNTSTNMSGTKYRCAITHGNATTNSNAATLTVNPVSVTTYTVTYNGNGNTGGSVPTDSASYASGSIVTVLGNTGSLAKTGYTFVGWNTAADGTGTTYAVGNTFTITGNTTLYAQWTKNSSGSSTGGGSTGGDAAATYYTITATAGTGGSISPTGSVSVREDLDKTFTITPDKGYVIAKVIVDGKSVGAVKSYTFADVSKKHTIKATFAPADEQRNPQTGVDMDFEDVSETDWFYESVAYVFDEGLMNGTSATTFSPYLDTTRGMIVTILHRLAGSDAPKDVAPFLDVTSDQYYATAVAWAYENGIVNGYSAEAFGPNDAITREQMAAILMNYAKFMGYDTTAAADLSKFSDADKISGYAVPSMAWANASGLINGKGDSILDPTGNAQRCEVAAILHRFCETIVK